MLLSLLVSSALGGTVFNACDEVAMNWSSDTGDTCEWAVRYATDEHREWEVQGRLECAALGGIYRSVLPQHKPAPDTCNDLGFHDVEGQAKCVCDSKEWSETIDGCGDDIFILTYWYGQSCDVIEPAANAYVEARKEAARWQCETFGGEMVWSANRYSLGCMQLGPSHYKYTSGWTGTCECPEVASNNDLLVVPLDDFGPCSYDIDLGERIIIDLDDELEPVPVWDIGR